MKLRLGISLAALALAGLAAWVIASIDGQQSSPPTQGRQATDDPRIDQRPGDLVRPLSRAPAAQPSDEESEESAPLEEDVLPEPPADPDDWDHLQWRRYHMTRYYRNIDWDAEPGANGDLGLLYQRALATMEQARGTGPLPSWDPDYSMLVALGVDSMNDRLVMNIDGQVYRFYPEVYPELRSWYHASVVGHDPDHVLPPGANPKMGPDVIEAIKARADEALLILPDL